MLLARREERLRELAQEIGGEYEVCDVADRSAVQATAARVLERHRLVHLLVNNAGIPARAGFLDADPDVIENTLRVNYLGGIWCLRAFLPGLEAAAPSDVAALMTSIGSIPASTMVIISRSSKYPGYVSGDPLFEPSAIFTPPAASFLRFFIAVAYCCLNAPSSGFLLNLFMVTGSAR